MSYDGTAYNGWQSQPTASGSTVQGTIQNALRTLLRDPIIEIVGCGRTDTGVHAKEFTAHFDLSQPIHTEDITYRLNKFLPLDIVIHKIVEVSTESHARFDAISRSYVYRLHIEKNPFNFHSFYYPYKTPNVEVLNKVASEMTRAKDFTAFCKTNSNNQTNICHITNCYWDSDGNNFEFKVSADRFLRGMIRLMVGACLNVDRGALTLDEVIESLAKGERLSRDWSVPGHGLTLLNIKYPYIV